MARLRLLSWQEWEKIFIYKGYYFVRQKGTHRSYAHQNNPEEIIVLIKTKETKKGTHRSYMRKLGIESQEELRKIMKEVGIKP